MSEEELLDKNDEITRKEKAEKQALQDKYESVSQKKKDAAFESALGLDDLI